MPVRNVPTQSGLAGEVREEAVRVAEYARMTQHDARD